MLKSDLKKGGGALNDSTNVNVLDLLCIPDPPCFSPVVLPHFECSTLFYSIWPYCLH
jgi:hypothetical protein